MYKNLLNLRNVATIVVCLAASATMFAQETGVVINGITWATRNVGAPGAFVTNPEDAGMFYQWNSKVGWTTAGVPSNGTSVWNKKWNGNGATAWEAANDPCPSGWHVPTEDDYASMYLNDLWTTRNGVSGNTFTDNSTGKSIFMPAAGYIDTTSVWYIGYPSGVYWCGAFGIGSPWVTGYTMRVMDFDAYGTYMHSREYAYGYSIRCVKNGSSATDDVSADTENAKVIGYFDILGRKLTEEPTKGFYIIQYDNGKSKKMMR